MDEQKKEFIFQHLQNELSLGRTIDVARVGLLKAGLCTKQEVESLIAEFRKKIGESTNAQGGFFLQDKSHLRPDWYAGPLDSTSSHWQLLKNYLSHDRGLSSLDIESIDRASSTVVANMAPPYTDHQLSVKGLVIGYVQSGKTTNYSSVIAKSIDAGYRLIIVLSGIHNNLRHQTEIRLNNEISLLKPEAATNLTKVDENGDFSRKQTLRAERALGRRDGFAIGVLKKNASVLRAFDMWLSEASPKTLHDCPILIIDDEADFASINTNNPDEEPTTINSLIRTISRRFKNSSFVGYTATPFANVLIDGSIDDDLYPRDFLLCLDKPLNYIGPEELFGSEALSNAGNKRPLPVIRFIDDDEATKYAATRRQQYNPKHFDEIGLSLRTAIFSFFISGSVRLCRGHWNRHITMLIHTSNLTDIHSKTYEIVDRFIKDLQIASGEALAQIRQDIEQIYNEDYLPICKKFPVGEELSFERVWKNIYEFVAKIEVIVENSKSMERLSFDRDDFLWGIVIGGNTLSRGLTLEGLTVSYYVRNAKGYDTLMQMGRWFGFRPNYVDVTRVFVTQQLYSNFFHLATVEEELREEIKALAENGERPIDVAIRIRKHPNMTITSNLKMKSAVEGSLTYSGVKIQERYIRTDDASQLIGNFNAVCSLLKKLDRQNIKEVKSHFKDFESYLLFRDAPSELVLQFLDDYRFSPANVRFDNNMLKSYIYDLNRVGELNRWSIAVISSRKGNALNLGERRSIFKVQRSIIPTASSSIDPTAKYLTALSPPHDELIDLDISMLNSKSIDSRSEFLKSIGKSWSAVRMSLRSKHQGLLLLYPLENNLVTSLPDQSLNGHRLEPLVAEGNLFGVTFVFPKSHSSQKSYTYAVNGSI